MGLPDVFIVLVRYVCTRAFLILLLFVVVVLLLVYVRDRTTSVTPRPYIYVVERDCALRRAKLPGKIDRLRERCRFSTCLGNANNVLYRGIAFYRATRRAVRSVGRRTLERRVC